VFAADGSRHARRLRRTDTRLLVKETAVEQMERKDNRSWLRRAWDAALRTAEAMEISPIEDLHDRIDRLEQEVAAMKAAPRRRAL